MDVEITDGVERNHDYESDTVVVISPEDSAFPGHRGEEGDVVRLAEHGHSIQGGQQGQRYGLQVTILTGE